MFLCLQISHTIATQMLPKIRIIDVGTSSNLNCIKCELGSRWSTELTPKQAKPRFQTSQDTLQPTKRWIFVSSNAPKTTKIIHDLNPSSLQIGFRSNLVFNHPIIYKDYIVVSHRKYQNPEEVRHGLQSITKPIRNKYK